MNDLGRDSDHGADVLVVGLGAMGAAVAYHASKRGMAVVGIDRHDPPHRFGSTHAESRITRLAVAEGPEYLPFVARSHELWREIEAAVDERFLYQCGGFIVTDPVMRGHRWPDFVDETAAIAELAGLEYEVMDPAAGRARQPLLKLPDDVRVGFEPTAGVVDSERALAAQLRLAREAGAMLRTDETVLEIRPDAHGVRVTTDRGAYRADRLVLATGPWFGEFAAPEHGGLVTVTRQVVHWFEVADLDAFSVDRFPFVMWVGLTDEDYLAVFPTVPGGTPGVKIMGEQFLDSTTPETVDRTVTEAESVEFYETMVEPKLDGVRPNCLRSAVCLYTSTGDERFLIDTDPRSDRITVMSPCSGHGFKHSTALGEAVVEWIDTGSSRLDLGPFRTPSG